MIVAASANTKGLDSLPARFVCAEPIMAGTRADLLWDFRTTGTYATTTTLGESVQAFVPHPQGGPARFANRRHPGNAAFVPPPADRVADLLGCLEQFVHDEAENLPPLVRIALARTG